MYDWLRYVNLHTIVFIRIIRIFKYFIVYIVRQLNLSIYTIYQTSYNVITFSRYSDIIIKSKYIAKALDEPCYFVTTE